MIGATRFACGLYDGANNPHHAAISSYCDQYDLQIASSGSSSFDKFNAIVEARGLNAIRIKLVKPPDWYCIADLDEFHFFGGKTMPEVVEHAEKAGYDAVQGLFCDRIASDGSFPEIADPLDERFPLGCVLTKCARLSCRKIVLAKANVPITPGHHKADGKVWKKFAEVHHFKWSEGVRERIFRTCERYSRQGRRWPAEKLPKLLGLVEHGVDIHNPKLHVRPATRIGI